jgi:carbon storage regulator
MLVLSRKIGERIVVPFCDLTITVVAVEGNKVRLGISAPPEVGVYREEVWHEIEDENKDLSPKARHVRSNNRQESPNPFFISVFHGEEPGHDFEDDD